MAIDDESFYNLLGQEISRSYLLQQMIDFYQMKREIGETKVTDFNEGSEIRNLLETVAVDTYVLMEEENELTKIGFIETAEGEYLDKHGANPFIKLERDTGQEATGFVTFSLTEAQQEEISIPEETMLVCEDNGLEYYTDHEGLIAVGETSCLVAVTCLTTGADGNINKNMLTLIDDDLDITGLSVTNEEAITGGTDYEEDDEYRERLLAYVRQDDFGSLPYYINLCQSVSGVHDVVLVDYNDPNSNIDYTKKVLVNGYVKETPSTVLLDVLTELTDSNKIVIGHNFLVGKPRYHILNLTVNLDVTVTLDEALLLNLLQTFFDGGSSDYIVDFDGLTIGQGVDKNTLMDVFSIVDGVVNSTIIDTSTGEELEPITVDSDEVLKLGTVNFSQTVVE